MPKKQRALALKSALAAKKDNLVVVQNFASITDGKTKQVAAALKDLKLTGQKILLVLDHVNDEDKRVQLAARNIDGLKVIHVSNLNVKDLLESEVVLTTESAIQTIHNRFNRLTKMQLQPKRKLLRKLQLRKRHQLKKRSQPKPTKHLLKSQLPSQRKNRNSELKRPGKIDEQPSITNYPQTLDQ